MTMSNRYSASLAVAALMSLGACMGSGTGDDGYEVSPRAVPPFPGTSVPTLVNNLDVKSGVPIPIDGTATYSDEQAAKLKGQFTLKTGTRNDEGDSTPAYVEAFLGTDFGNLTTRIQQNGGTSKTVAGGRIVKTTLRDTEIIYLQAAGSDMHVGLFNHSEGDIGGTGIFGSKTTAAGVATMPTAGSASYVGVANLTINDEQQRVVHDYRGTMTANVNFANSAIGYRSNDLTRSYNNGGPKSATMTGAATYGKNGAVAGDFNVTPLGGGKISGQTRGNLYGPSGQNVGLIFEGRGISGGAILGQ